MTDVCIVSEPLGGSALSQCLQRRDAPAAWLPALPSTPDEWRALATERVAAGGWRERLAALAPAMQATGAAAERIERVRREGGVVVTTGQQPGLFGGPVYTWSKAVSALALADEIEARTGVPTAAVFWAATDDADFAEASSTVVARAGGAEVLRAMEEPRPGTPMALAPLGNLKASLERLREACGSAADPRALDAVLAAYADPAHTHGTAFVALLRAFLAPLGMPVLDASHQAVRDESVPTILAAFMRAPAIETALARRAADIRREGFTPQVEDVAGLSLAFMREGTTKRRLTLSEASRAARTSGGTYTPNVLLRPIVERAILPTVAYVAGPGELAYFAQVSAVAGVLGVPTPVAVPRWSATLIEPHVQKLLDRFHVQPLDLAAPHTLERDVARGAMSESTAKTLADLREAIAMLPDALGAESEANGLGPAIVGAVHALEHRVGRLERRIVAAVKRRETALMRDVATLRAALYPQGVRQERLLNPIPIFTRHGLTLLDEMRDAARAHARSLVEPSPLSAEAPMRT